MPIILGEIIPPGTPKSESRRNWAYGYKDSESNSLVHARVPCQKEAQSSCQPSPHQLDDAKLAYANKAKSSSAIESQILGMSFWDCFFWGTSGPTKPSQGERFNREMRSKKQLTKNIVSFGEHPWRPHSHVLGGLFWGTSLKRQFCYGLEISLGKKSRLVTS